MLAVDFILLLSILLYRLAEGGNNTQELQCQLPFTNIGGQCYMVATTLETTWQEANNYCFQLGGRLAVINDPTVHYHLVKFIKDRGLDNHDYWIGASDREVEGVWKWLDGNDVMMGSPLWGYSEPYKQRPSGGTGQNCGTLWREFFFDMNDLRCGESLPCICEQVAWNLETS